MNVKIIKCLKDNYSYLIIDKKNTSACVIDPSESQPIINFLEKKNLKLNFILIHIIIMTMLVEMKF